MPIQLTPNPSGPNPIAPSEKQLTVQNRVGSVLVDLDTLPILRDPTRAFGVISADGGIVIAADGINNIFTKDPDVLGTYYFTITNLVPGITYTAWIETVFEGATNRRSTTWTAGVAIAEGYYAKRSKLLATAGKEQFDAEMRLDALALIADEDVVQLALENADTLVDGIAWMEGIAAAGTPPHFVATDDPIFAMLSLWASRWARADGHLLRGELNDTPEDLEGGPPNQSAEGVFRKMKTEAEKKIKDLLAAKRARQSIIGTGRQGIAVGYQPGVRPSCGIDPAVRG